MAQKIFEPIGLLIAGVTGILSLILFYTDTKVFFGSLFAALIAAGMAWITFVILRLLCLALKK